MSSDSTRGVLTRHIDPRPGRPGSSSLGERRNDEMRASSAARSGVGARLPGNPDRDGGHDTGMSEDMRANSMLSDESSGRNLRSAPSSRQKSVQLMRQGGLSSVRVRIRRIHRAPRGMFPAVVHPRVTPRSRRRPIAFRVLLTARGRKIAPGAFNSRLAGSSRGNRIGRRGGRLSSCYRHATVISRDFRSSAAEIGPRSVPRPGPRSTHPPRQRRAEQETHTRFPPAIPDKITTDRRFWFFARPFANADRERTHRTNASPT